MRPDPTMEPDLDDSVPRLRSSEHRLAFTNRMARWFLDKNVSPGLQCINAGHRMPVIWCGDDDDFRSHLCQQLSIVIKHLWLITRLALNLICRHLKRPLIDITKSHYLALTRSHCLAKDIRPPPTASDQCRTITLPWHGAEERHRKQRGTGETRRLDEISPRRVHFHSILKSESNLRIPSDI
jgi:hypothetical protein